jgi:hypothetical protein
MADRTFHVAVQNVNATKLDYYVKPSVRMVISLTAQGTAVVRTTIHVLNEAPSGPSSYQLGPYPGSPYSAGEYVTRTQLWGPAGSIQLESQQESGLVANQETFRVPPGKATDATFETVIPNAVRNGHLEIRLVPQSRLEPMSIELVLTTQGWSVQGARDLRRSWDQTFVATWDVHH